MLQTITNDAGVTTTLSYSSLYQAAQSNSNVGTSPVPVELVTSIETNNGLSGPYAFDSTTSYSYESARYDARDRQFLGFQKVQSTVLGDSSGPGVVTETQFVTDTCAVAPSRPCTPGADYGYRLQRGLPAVILRSVADGVHAGSKMDTTVNTTPTRGCTRRGRANRAAALSVREGPYLWQAGLQDGRSPFLTLLQEVGPNATHEYDWAKLPVPLPPGGGRDHLRRTFHLDLHGNEDSVVDYGAPDDQGISVASRWNLPGNDPTGWHYEVTETDSEYLGASSPERILKYDYYSNGLVRTVQSVGLSGTAPLARSNGSNQFAQPPPSASVNGNVVTFAAFVYDAYGNVKETTGPSGQCTDITYDTAYQQLPVTFTSYVNGCGSASPLVTSRAYNRGAEHVTMKVSPSNETAIIALDAFGRVKSVWEPDPDNDLQTEPNPVLTVDYTLYDQPAPGGVRRLQVTKNVGTIQAPIPATVWQYFDGLGRHLLDVRQAEAPNGWAVEGASQLGTTTGRTGRTWRPFFAGSLSGDGSTYDFTTTPQGPSTTFQYDAQGRVVHTTDELSRDSVIIYDPLTLSQTVFDAEQLAKNGGPLNQNGPHNRTSTKLTFDGHGRMTQSSAAIMNPRPDTIKTTLTYLATDAVTSVVKSHAGGESYRRTMVYDSLGRLVENDEPNTSFHVNPQVQVPHEWMYAYDDSGRLVGTSDARGCGENITYDGLNRVTTEDYSPCTDSQLPYTSEPEVTNVYDQAPLGALDAPRYRGRLTEVANRAQVVDYTFDGRAASRPPRNDSRCPVEVATRTTRSSAPSRTTTRTASSRRPRVQTRRSSYPRAARFSRPRTVCAGASPPSRCPTELRRCSRSASSTQATARPSSSTRARRGRASR